MLRGQGGVAPAALRGNGGPVACLALICMHDSPPTCPCLAFQGWVPVLWVFLFLLSASLLALLAIVPAATAEDCSRLRVAVETCHLKGVGPEPIVGPPGLWTCRRVDCRWFHLVEQTANDNARCPSASNCRQAGPWPLPIRTRNGWAGRQAVPSRSCPPFCSATADYS